MHTKFVRFLGVLLMNTIVAKCKWKKMEELLTPEKTANLRQWQDSSEELV